MALEIALLWRVFVTFKMDSKLVLSTAIKSLPSTKENFFFRHFQIKWMVPKSLSKQETEGAKY